MRLLRHETQVLSPTRRRGRRRAAEAQLGQTLPLICFFMMSLLGVSGLVLDLGNGYTQRRAIQNEADAAAIAGADAIVSGNYSSAAQQMAAKNGRPADQVSVTFDGTDTVTVTVSRVAPTFFLKVFGKSSIPVSATAVASRRVVRPEISLRSPSAGARCQWVQDANAVGEIDDWVITSLAWYGCRRLDAAPRARQQRPRPEAMTLIYFADGIFGSGPCHSAPAEDLPSDISHAQPGGLADPLLIRGRLTAGCGTIQAGHFLQHENGGRPRGLIFLKGRSRVGRLKRGTQWPSSAAAAGASRSSLTPAPR